MKTLVLTKYGKMFAPTVAHFVASGWDDMQMIAAGFADYVDAAAGESPIKLTPDVVKELRHHIERDLLNAQRADLLQMAQKVTVSHGDPSGEIRLALEQLLESLDKRLAALGVPHPGEHPNCRSVVKRPVASGTDPLTPREDDDRPVPPNVQFAGRAIRPSRPTAADPVPGDDDE